jgi:hypothetical protein
MTLRQGHSMPITIYLKGQEFDPETKRVMGSHSRSRVRRCDLRIETILSSRWSPRKSSSLRKLVSITPICCASGY